MRAMVKAPDDSLRKIMPQQNPVAKLLNHRAAGGSTHKNLKKSAGSIKSAAVKFALNDDMNVLKKPEAGEVRPAISEDDRAELFSSERFMLKKKPAHRPVRNMKMKIRIIFFIRRSPFYRYMI